MQKIFDINKFRDSKPYWSARKSYLLLTQKRRTALASFPRSGNTWLRNLLEECTNKQSGSIYQDLVMDRNSDGIVIKTHDSDSFRYTHALHLIRNPFDAIYSFYLYTLQVENKQVEWDSYVINKTNLWKQHTVYWKNCEMPVLRIRYEDLINNTHNELERILKWMNIEYTYDGVENAIEYSNIQLLRKKYPVIGEKFFREGKIGGGLFHFSDNQKRFVSENLSELLNDLGYHI